LIPRFRSAVLMGVLGFGSAVAATVPRPATPFTFKIPQKGDISFSQYAGKTLVVAFIRFTCPHCQQLTQAMIPVQDEYAAKGVQCLALDFTEDGPTRWAAFVAQFRPNFPVGYGDRDKAMGFLQIPIMTPGYVPKLVFIDKTGTIRAQYAGDDAFFQDHNKGMRAKLDELLAPPKRVSVKKAATK